jgi:hypothetical protein
MRFVYIVAGLFLAANAVFIGLRLYETQSRLTLAAVGPILLAAFAFGTMLVVRNVKPAPPEPLEEEPPEQP